MPVVALPAIAVVLVAAVAALLLFAAPAFIRLLQETIGALPVVGGAVAGALGSALGSITSGLMRWANAVVGPAATFVFGITSAIWSLPAAATDAMWSLVGMTDRVRQDASAFISAVGAQLATDVKNLNGLAWYVGSVVTNNLIGALNATAAGLSAAVNTVQANLNTAVTNLNGLAWYTAGQAVDQAKGLIVALQNGVEGLISGVRSDISGVASNLGAAIGSAEAKAASDLRTAVNGVEGFAITAAAAAANTLERQLDQAAHDVVVGPWAALLPQVQSIIDALPGEVTQAIPGLGAISEPVPATLPGVLSVLAPAMAAVGTEVARCTVPMCTNLGGLSSLLGSLADDAFWALLIALVAESVADPGSAATSLASDVAPGMASLAAGVASLVGA